MAYLIQGEHYPVVFLANPRTGSTAIAKTLMAMGAEKIGEHHDEPDEYPEDALIVHTVRNHLDAIISYWAKRASGHKFADFIDIIVSGKQPYFPPVMLYGWSVKPNFPLKYETLEYEFANLCVCAGLPEVELERTENTARSQDMSIENMFTGDLMRKITNYYGAEMEELGYGDSKPQK